MEPTSGAPLSTEDLGDQPPFSNRSATAEVGAEAGAAPAAAGDAAAGDNSGRSAAGSKESRTGIGSSHSTAPNATQQQQQQQQQQQPQPQQAASRNSYAQMHVARGSSQTALLPAAATAGRGAAAQAQKARSGGGAAAGASPPPPPPPPPPLPVDASQERQQARSQPPTAEGAGQAGAGPQGNPSATPSYTYDPAMQPYEGSDGRGSVLDSEEELGGEEESLEAIMALGRRADEDVGAFLAAAAGALAGDPSDTEPVYVVEDADGTGGDWQSEGGGGGGGAGCSGGAKRRRKLELRERRRALRREQKRQLRERRRALRELQRTAGGGGDGGDGDGGSGSGSGGESGSESSSSSHSSSSSSSSSSSASPSFRDSVGGSGSRGSGREGSRGSSGGARSAAVSRGSPDLGAARLAGSDGAPDSASSVPLDADGGQIVMTAAGLQALGLCAPPPGGEVVPPVWSSRPGADEDDYAYAVPDYLRQSPPNPAPGLAAGEEVDYRAAAGYPPFPGDEYAPSSSPSAFSAASGQPPEVPSDPTGRNRHPAGPSGTADGREGYSPSELDVRDGATAVSGERSGHEGLGGASPDGGCGGGGGGRASAEGGAGRPPSGGSGGGGGGELHYMAARDERSRNIAAQLAALQEESRRLQQQSVLLQQRTREIGRSVGLPTPPGLQAALGAEASETMPPQGRAPVTAPVGADASKPRVSSPDRSLVPESPDGRSGPHDRSPRCQPAGDAAVQQGAEARSAVPAAGAAAVEDRAAARYAPGSVSTSISGSILASTSASASASVNMNASVSAGLNASALLAPGSLAATPQLGGSKATPINWALPNRNPHPNPKAPTPQLQHRLFASPPKGAARLERAASSSSFTDAALPRWSEQMESPLGTPLRRSPEKRLPPAAAPPPVLPTGARAPQAGMAAAGGSGSSGVPLGYALPPPPQQQQQVQQVQPLLQHVPRGGPPGAAAAAAGAGGPRAGGSALPGGSPGYARSRLGAGAAAPPPSHAVARAPPQAPTVPMPQAPHTQVPVGAGAAAFGGAHLHPPGIQQGVPVSFQATEQQIFTPAPMAPGGAGWLGALHGLPMQSPPFYASGFAAAGLPAVPEQPAAVAAGSRKEPTGAAARNGNARDYGSRIPRPKPAAARPAPVPAAAAAAPENGVQTGHGGTSGGVPAAAAQAPWAVAAGEMPPGMLPMLLPPIGAAMPPIGPWMGMVGQQPTAEASAAPAKGGAIGKNGPASKGTGASAGAGPMRGRNGARSAAKPAAAPPQDAGFTGMPFGFPGPMGILPLPAPGAMPGFLPFPGLPPPNPGLMPVLPSSASLPPVAASPAAGQPRRQPHGSGGGGGSGGGAATSLPPVEPSRGKGKMSRSAPPGAPRGGGAGDGAASGVVQALPIHFPSTLAGASGAIATGPGPVNGFGLGPRLPPFGFPLAPGGVGFAGMSGAGHVDAQWPGMGGGGFGGAPGLGLPVMGALWAAPLGEVPSATSGDAAALAQRADDVEQQQLSHYREMESKVLGRIGRQQQAAPGAKGRERRVNSHDGRPVFRVF